MNTDLDLNAETQRRGEKQKTLEIPYVVSYKFNKPGFGQAEEFHKLTAPMELEGTGMEGVVGENQVGALPIG
jgi:hypothetical protein